MLRGSLCVPLPSITRDEEMLAASCRELGEGGAAPAQSRRLRQFRQRTSRGDASTSNNYADVDTANDVNLLPRSPDSSTRRAPLHFDREGYIVPFAIGVPAELLAAIEPDFAPVRSFMSRERLLNLREQQQQQLTQRRRPSDEQHDLDDSSPPDEPPSPLVESPPFRPRGSPRGAHLVFARTRASDGKAEGTLIMRVAPVELKVNFANESA